MNHRHQDGQDPLVSRLKRLIAKLFSLDIPEPDSISAHSPLIGGDLGLDSFDAVELAICIEEEFGLNLHGRDDSYRAFISISSMADFIRSHTQTDPAAQRRAADSRLLSQALTAFSQG